MDATRDRLAEVDLEGNVRSSKGQTLWRLSEAAFSDLCHFSGVPVAFIKRFAAVDESQAMEVLATCIREVFHRGPSRQLVIDTRFNRVEGIVGAATYSPLRNSDALSYSQSAGPDMEFTNGWLRGPDMRFTLVLKGGDIAPVKGDVVRLGVSGANSIQGDGSFMLADYCERVVCTNGMVARVKEHCSRIPHRGDIQLLLAKTVMGAAQRVQFFAPLLQGSARQRMTPEGVLEFRRFVSDSGNGYNGSAKLDAQVVVNAQAEAEAEGRLPQDVTLYNMVNGVTKAAHATDSLERRVELESLGYATLVRFGTAWK
jgi:hypothetical protein